MAHAISMDDFQGPNERAAAERLTTELPNSWFLLCNKQIVQGEKSREVDLICIGSRTVFVIEEKGWSGGIRGTENGWLVNGELRTSPLNQCEMSSKMLAGILKYHLPALTAYGTELVTGIVLMSSPHAEVQINDPRCNRRVISLQEAAKKLIAYDAASENPPFGPLGLKIMEQMTKLPQRKKVPQRIGEFKIIEQLDEQVGCQVYRGEHADGALRILKVFYGAEAFAGPPTNDTSVRRQYDAQRKLAEHDLCPAVDSYFTWDDGRALVLPFALPKGKTLGQLAVVGPAQDQILPVMLAACSALRQVSENGVIHRSLRPDRVWWDHKSGKIRFSDFLIARLDGQETVVASADRFDVDHPYWAYETRFDLGNATHKSDVYSLAAVLVNWITGAEPPSSDNWTPGPLSEYRKDLDSIFAQKVESILYPAFEFEPTGRPTAAQLEAEIKAALEATQVKDSIAKRELLDVISIDPRYQILETLGKGGTAETFLAKDLHRDELVVLKRLMRPDINGYLATTEFKALNRLRHECLPRLIEVYGPSDNFHLKLEYIEGRSLKDAWRQYRGCGNEKKLQIVERIATDVLSALEYLHSSKFLHRDVTPGNILIPEDDRSRIRLIDFGLASDLDNAKSRVGTPLYLAPEIEQPVPAWSEKCDLYGLGVVLFELLAEQLPYTVDGHRRLKDKLIDRQTFAAPGQLNELILLILEKACHPNPAHRFASAEEMRLAILSLYRKYERLEVTQIEPSNHAVEVITTSSAPPALTPQTNTFVAELRQAFRNSRLGNSNNRGMDSKFSRNTYVRTELDALLPDILSGKWKCVALSGNPGDGKTAFLEEVKRELLEHGAETSYDNAAGWKLKLNEHAFVSVYDASESHEGASADELLRTAIEPLAGKSRPDTAVTILLAINDGRLQDLISTLRLSFKWLCNALRDHMHAKPDAEPSVLLIDLKHRAPISRLNSAKQSLFLGLLDAFIGPQNWSICSTCSANRDCTVFSNAAALRNDHPRGQLVEILSAVYFLADRRPTIRDLRSALSWIITGDRDCQQVHQEMASGASHDTRYYNLAFDDRSGEDLVLNTFRRLDPASDVNPRLDRLLAVGEQSEPVIPSEANHPASAGGRTVLLPDSKRRAYFESEDVANGIKATLPVRTISEFFALVSGQISLQSVKKKILVGLQRFDRVPPHAASNELAFRLDSTEAQLIVVRRWKEDEFVLELPSAPASVLNHLPDHLIFRHMEGWPTMAIGLQMYEILTRAADGLTPDASEHQSLLMELERFKAQLMTRPTHEVILVNAGGDRSLVRSSNGRIERTILEAQ